MSQSCLAAALAVIASIVALPAAAQMAGSDVDARPDPAVVCHVGIYRLDDGSWVDVAPQASSGLRWRRLDGATARMTLDGQGR
ncbi:MAG: hypothetical protein ACK4MI_03145 [Brevundimonas sp.]|uniref:hypothetical protein n=1 Tax=Brevundimonas sp. TaxID=1871086 RepID=UPI0028D5EAEC|nr:hypothetical protein [uncultured Brevundimonas sp.]